MSSEGRQHAVCGPRRIESERRNTSGSLSEVRRCDGSPLPNARLPSRVRAPRNALSVWPFLASIVNSDACFAAMLGCRDRNYTGHVRGMRTWHRTDTPERANASAYLPSVLSTYARNDNKGGRRRTAALRHQSDDSSRIDRDPLGRFGGGDRRVLGGCVSLPRSEQLHRRADAMGSATASVPRGLRLRFGRLRRENGTRQFTRKEAAGLRQLPATRGGSEGTAQTT